MPPIALSDVGIQFLPSTPHTAKGSYVNSLHNIPHPPPPTIGPNGHASFYPIGLISQPHTSSWVPPQ